MILKEPVAALLARRNYYVKAESYYEGDVAESFSSAKLARLFARTGHTTLNFCRPIVHAVSNRLAVASITAEKTRANKIIGNVFEVNEFAIEEREFYRKTGEYGDSFAIVWPNKNGEWQITSNSPVNTTIVYDPENPREKLYAAKTWYFEGSVYLNIYTDSELKKYKAQSESLEEGLNWTLYDTVDNPFGEVPVFHFRTERPFGRPEHEVAYDAQDYINKLFTTNMHTIDYQGAPQRYALAVGENSIDDFDDDEVERANVNALKSGPGELWYLNNVTSVGEFKPADPTVFWGPIQNTLEIIASSTETPLHYFRNNGSFISGEAWRTAEGVLKAKIETRKQSYASTWRAIFKFILKNEGIDTDVEVKWLDNDNLDTIDRWDVILKKINAGISVHQALREGGYDEATIERNWEEKLAEAEQINLYERNQSANGTPTLTRVEQTRATTTNDETNRGNDLNG